MPWSKQSDHLRPPRAGSLFRRPGPAFSRAKEPVPSGHFSPRTVSSDGLLYARFAGDFLFLFKMK